MHRHTLSSYCKVHEPFENDKILILDRETAAQENATAYYPLLDRIADGYFDGQATEKELYDTFLQLLQDDAHIADADALSSFQFALSIHSAAPRIEAHYQFYNTSVEPSLKTAQGDECEAWVLLGEKQYCRPELDKSHGAVAGARYVILRINFGSNSLTLCTQERTLAL